MPSGIVHDLIVSPNGLGWLDIKPAMEREAVRLILQAQITDGSFTFTLSPISPCRLISLWFCIGPPRRSSITPLLARVLASMEPVFIRATLTWIAGFSSAVPSPLLPTQHLLQFLGSSG
jgi:hypothetical protein